MGVNTLLSLDGDNGLFSFDGDIGADEAIVEKETVDVLNLIFLPI